MKTEKEAFDYEATKQKALEQFRSGKSLYGKDGAFAPLLKDFLETALEAELEAHLDQERRKNGNRRNGQSSEILKTADGSFELSTSRDRNSDFEPQIVRKRETI